MLFPALRLVSGDSDFQRGKMSRKPHSWCLRPERLNLDLAAHCTDLSLPSSPSIQRIFCSGGISEPEAGSREQGCGRDWRSWLRCEMTQR